MTFMRFAVGRVRDQRLSEISKVSARGMRKLALARGQKRVWNDSLKSFLT